MADANGPAAADPEPAEPASSEPGPFATEPSARLETGWFADTPIDDTLTRQFVIADGEWMESCTLAAGQAMLRTDDFVAVDDHSPDLLLNTGILLRPITPAARRRRRRRPAAVLRRRRWPVLDVLPMAHGAPGAHRRRLSAAAPARARRRTASTPPELTIEEATTRTG